MFPFTFKQLPEIAHYNKEKGTVSDAKVEIDNKKQFLKIPFHSVGKIQVLNDFKMVSSWLKC